MFTTIRMQKGVPLNEMALMGALTDIFILVWVRAIDGEFNSFDKVVKCYSTCVMMHESCKKCDSILFDSKKCGINCYAKSLTAKTIWLLLFSQSGGVN